MNNLFSNARLKKSLRDGVGIFFVIVSVFILKACASIAPPGGGPEDKIAPTILETSPATDSTHVSRFPEITIVFSEAMDHVSIENAFFMMPSPTRVPDLDWDGSTLHILLKDSLAPNRTCVISIGSEAKDRHQNPLGRTFTMAFSTGEKIDRGTISGHILDPKPSTAVWAYIINDASNLDSALFKRRADYVTQVGSLGDFALNYLTPGSYRIYAVIDADKDFVYTPGVDAIGLPTRDVIANEARPDFMDFTTSSEDTTRLIISDAVPYKNHILKIQINKFVRDSFSQANFSIVDSASGNIISIHNGFRFDRTNFTEFRVFCDSLENEKTYRLIIRSLRATNDSARQVEFYFKGDSRESDEPRMEWLNSSSLLRPNENLNFRFALGVDTSELRRFAVLYKDSIRRNVAWQWASSGYGAVNLKSLVRGQTYRLEIPGDSVHDRLGKKIADSVMNIRFQVLSEDTLGILSGDVRDEDSLASGKIYLQFRRVDADGLSALTLDLPGKFTRDLLLPGSYKILGFRDSDHNGEWTKGNTWPLIFAERTLMSMDSVIVRRNWETSNILLRFKK